MALLTPASAGAPTAVPHAAGLRGRAADRRGRGGDVRGAARAVGRVRVPARTAPHPARDDRRRGRAAVVLDLPAAVGSRRHGAATRGLGGGRGRPDVDVAQLVGRTRRRDRGDDPDGVVHLPDAADRSAAPCRHRRRFGDHAGAVTHATALEEEPSSRVTLLFGNRRTSTVMFLEELEDLKNRYPGRFHLVHVLSREPQDVDLFHGRLDPERLARILDVLVPVGQRRRVVPVRAVRHGHRRARRCSTTRSRPAATSTTRSSTSTSRVTRVRLRGRPSTPPHRRRRRSRSTWTAGPPRSRCRRSTSRSSTRRCGSVPTRRSRARTGYAAPAAPVSCPVRCGWTATTRSSPTRSRPASCLACQSHPVTDQVNLDYDT